MVEVITKALSSIKSVEQCVRVWKHVVIVILVLHLFDIFFSVYLLTASLGRCGHLLVLVELEDRLVEALDPLLNLDHGTLSLGLFLFLNEIFEIEVPLQGLEVGENDRAQSFEVAPLLLGVVASELGDRLIKALHHELIVVFVRVGYTKLDTRENFPLISYG